MSHSEGIDYHTYSSTLEEESLLSMKDVLEFSLSFKERGKELFEEQKYEQALELYEVVISILPPINMKKYRKLKADCYSNCAQFMINLRCYHQAIEYASEAIHLDSKHIKALFRRGYAKSILRLYHESVADYKEALILDPKNPVIRSELLHVLQILQAKIDHTI